MACESTKAPSSEAVISAADIYNKPLSSLVARSNGKYRLSRSYIRDIISQRPQALPTTEYMAPLFPPEWLEEKKREYEEEVVLCQQMIAEQEEFRQQVIEGVKKNGYFEVDEEFIASMKAAHESDLEVWDRINFSRLQIATPEEEIDEDDALLSVDEEVEYIRSLVTEDVE